MKPDLAFGKVLQKMRLEYGFSQLELAHKAGLDRTFISMLERGERQPTITTIFEISRAMKILPSKMMSEVEQLMKLRSGRAPLIPSRRL